MRKTVRKIVHFAETLRAKPVDVSSNHRVADGSDDESIRDDHKKIRNVSMRDSREKAQIHH